MIFHNLGKLSFAINLYSKIISKEKDCVQIRIKRIVSEKYYKISNTLMYLIQLWIEILYYSAAAFFFVFEFTEHRKSHHIYI